MELLATGVTIEPSGPVLARSFVIAVIIMAPVALWQWKRMRDARAARQGGQQQPIAEPEPADTLESLIAEVDRLAPTIAAGEVRSLVTPAGLTLAGRPVAPDLLQQLVVDAAARGALEATVSGDADALHIELRRR